MSKTGLAERLSYYIFTLFPVPTRDSFGVLRYRLYSRTGYPFYDRTHDDHRAHCLGHGAEFGTRAPHQSALIMLTVVKMAVVPGLESELGSLNGQWFSRCSPTSVSLEPGPLRGGDGGSDADSLRSNSSSESCSLGRNSAARLRRLCADEAGPLWYRYKRQEMITALVVVVSTFTVGQTGALHSASPHSRSGCWRWRFSRTCENSRMRRRRRRPGRCCSLWAGFRLGNVIVDAKITDWMAGLDAPPRRSLVRPLCSC